MLRKPEMARVNFQEAVKEIYAIEDDKEVKPAMEYKEYDVGENLKALIFKRNNKILLLVYQ